MPARRTRDRDAATPAGLSRAVFISYRRSTSAIVARAVFQDLRAHGIDAFMDVESIDSGQFDTIIKRQIEARPYFLLVLTPTALERCRDAGDWVGREIDHALTSQRVIIPIVTPDFDRAEITRCLVGRAAEELPRFSTLNLVHEYWEAAMEKLRTRFLQPIAAPAAAAAKEDEAIVERKLARAAAEPISEEQMKAQPHLERAALLMESDAAAAVSEFDAAIRLQPGIPWAYAGRGAARHRMGDSAGALADLDAAIAMDASEGEFYRLRGGIRGLQDDWQGALADAEARLRLHPNSPEGLVTRVIARSRVRRDVDQIPADLARAIELDPSYAEAYFWRGVVKAALGDQAGALSDYDAAIRLGSTNPLVYGSRAEARIGRGDLAGALEDYRAALANDPHPDTRAGAEREIPRLEALLASGPPPAMSAAPTDAAGFLNRGADRDADDLTGMLTDFTEAIRLDPASAEARLCRGIVHYRQNHYTHAQDDLDEAVRLGPDRADAYYWRALVHLAKHEFAPVVSDLDAALRLGLPEAQLAEAHLYRGAARRATGDLDGAISDYTRVIDVDAKRPQAYLWRGIAYAEKHAYGKASSDFRLVTSLFPGTPAAEDAEQRGVALVAQMAGEAAVNIGEGAVSLGRSVFGKLFGSKRRVDDGGA